MMSNLQFRLSDMQFNQPCQYYLSLQLDENKKRLRTKVSAETKNPIFDEEFSTTDFEEDFAIIGTDAIQRTLTLDVFVVLTKSDATSAHELLGSVTVPLPKLEASSTSITEVRSLAFTRLEKKTNSKIDVGRFKMDIRQGPFDTGGAARLREADHGQGPRTLALSKPATPALSVASASESAAATPGRYGGSDVVRLVVHARSATFEDAMEGELRLRCEITQNTISSSAETAARLCAGTTVVWNELLVLEAPRDAELCLSVVGTDRSVSLDVGLLEPFRSYTLDLPLEGGGAARVTVAAHDAAEGASTIVYVLKPVLDLGGAEGTMVAVAQMVKRSEVADLEAARRNEPPPFPVTRPPAPDYTPDGAVIRRRPTFYTDVAGGRAVWEDQSVVFPSDGPGDACVLLDFYGGAGDDLKPAHVGSCVMDVPSNATGDAGTPVNVPVQQNGARVGTCAARLRVESRAAPQMTARTSHTARSTTPALLSRGLTPGPQLAATTEWEAATRRGPPIPGDDNSDPRVRRLADDLQAKSLAVQRLVAELKGRGDALRACGAELAALRRRAAQAETARAALEARVTEADAARVKDRRTFEQLVAERKSGRSGDPSDPAAQLQAAAALCAQLQRDNADLAEASGDAAAAEAKLRDLAADHAHLRRAHTQQAAYVQSLQDDRAKADAYRTTIGVQERVIAKLEGLVAGSLRELALGRKAELADTTHRLDPSFRNEAAQLTAAVVARDRRIALLEDQLHEQATRDAQELAQARLKIFEMEMERAGPPREDRAPGFAGVVEEATRASRREAADRDEFNRFRAAGHAAAPAAPVPSPGFADVVGEAMWGLPAVPGASAYA